jgi:FxsC-like protein
MTCWFFMSYARADNERGEYVRDFYDDLKAEIASKVPDQSPPIGFMDEENLKPGDPWPVNIAEALCNCRTFVPIMTARFFTREYCGQEWTIFEDRCKSASDPSKLSPLIIPVLWDQPQDGKLPEYATKLHRAFDPAGVPKEEREKFGDYMKYGLLWVIKRKNETHRVIYDTILDQLARRIIDVAGQYPVPVIQGNTPPSLEDVSSRFHANQVSPQAGAALSSSCQAHFAFVAGTQAQMATVRANARQYYGAADSREWMPYAPQEKEPIAVLAQSAATELNLYCEWLIVKNDIVKNLRAAEERNSVAIMIVDPWTASLPEYAKVLTDFDEHQFANCAVLVVWNPGDPQTKDKRDALLSGVRQAMRRRFYVPNKVYLRSGVETPSDLRVGIAESLRVLEDILAQFREPTREVAQGDLSAPPTVSTSGGTA